jgi:sulfate adenylyltransferase subunit 2
MLWSIGKDSTVLLWLARKAFMGNIPFPLVHIDTSYKIPEMIAYRDNLVAKLGIDMIYGQDSDSLSSGDSFPTGRLSRLECCGRLKTSALKKTLSGAATRYRFNHEKGQYEVDPSNTKFDGVIVGVRSDEEGSRSKERYFSVRDVQNSWNIGEQPPELWDQYNTDVRPGAHVRIHPLLDWTELNIWQYIAQENIPVIDIYFDLGKGERYRSLGCYPCTSPIQSNAKNVAEVIEELENGRLAMTAERAGRMQDQEGEGGLESLRRDGYM